MPSFNTVAKEVSYVVIGGIVLGLIFRYFGKQPVITDARQGLNGDVAGTIFN